MGRSSHGRSPSYHPGSGNPIVGRRFNYQETPTWSGLFGETIQGEYGSRIRSEPIYREQIRASISKIRDSAEDYLRNIREDLSRISGQERQDYLDRTWIALETNISNFRDQQVLYRHTPLEPVLNQAIASEIYLLNSVEAFYEYEPGRYRYRSRRLKH